MDFNDTKIQLNIMLGDTENITFTEEEKTRALTSAWNDAYVVAPISDTSLTYVSGTFDYAVPSGMKVIQGVGYARSAADSPDEIPSDMYTVSNGTISFGRGGDGAYIPTNTILVLSGKFKLDPESDTIDDTTMQEYVIALAGVNTLTLLGYKKVNLFLKNDTTMSELVTLKRELQADVARLRLMLPKSFESA